MKKLVNLFYIFISVFITTSCSRNLYPPVLEIDLVKDNRYHIKEHETGHFLVNINPIEYKKNKHYMTLKGIVSYSGKDIYSQRYDTLINGIEGVTIFLCKMDRYKKELTIKKTLLKADCHGIFKISFKRNRKLYLIFEGNNINTTGLNTDYYFKDFKNNYYSSLIISSSDCK